MTLAKHKKEKDLLIEIDKGVVSIVSVLQNMVKMQGTISNGKLKVAS